MDILIRKAEKSKLQDLILENMPVEKNFNEHIVE